QWLRIHTHADDCEGWIDEKQIVRLDPNQFKATQQSSFCLTDLTATAFSKSGSLILVIGSSLPNYSNQHFTINGEDYQTDGDVTQTDNRDLSNRISWNALKFAGMPYLWGGRSLFGMDCSGFTNVVFKLSGIKLRRDAWQQSEQGILVSFIDQTRPGDLAFFQNEENRITHVGIILENHKIIHASGKVRIDTIDHYGIYNEEQKRYTHQLRLLKRIIV
ncbi:MAG: C40 family peptidase, partial [Chitinophagales bacterium]